MTELFSHLTIRDVSFRNRIFVSPMCQYSSQDGLPNNWHLVHLGSRAVGGAGLVMVEASAVSPEGRITPADTGIWNDEQAEAFLPITGFIREQGSVAAIQLAHAGRKAGSSLPWTGGRPLSAKEGGWTPIGPSPLPFNQDFTPPKEMNAADIEQLIRNFQDAAQRSHHAGFDVIELHMAHGYLLHEFLSPLSNQRKDGYGGDFEGRIRLPLEIVQAVREVWPHGKPLFVRISATDWLDDAWDIEQSVELALRMKEMGVDLIDCSSGGNSPHARIPVGPGFQVVFAETLRKKAKIATGAVGLIVNPKQAQDIISHGQADAVFIAREMLRNPYWPLHAAHALHAKTAWPKQYERAKPLDAE